MHATFSLTSRFLLHVYKLEAHHDQGERSFLNKYVNSGNETTRSLHSLYEDNMRGRNEVTFSRGWD